MILTRQVVLSFDGACEPKNPGGIATFGVVVAINGETMLKKRGVVGDGGGMTNNVAEYQGLIEGLREIGELLQSGDRLTIRSDSQLVIRQLTGMYQVRSPRIYPQFKKAKRLLRRVRSIGVDISLEWVPREENEDADRLSHEAFVEYCQKKGYLYIPCECGGTLVPRINRKTGHKFLGCSRFPRCRNTAPYPGEEELDQEST